MNIQNRWGWGMVAAGGSLGCVAMGAMFSLPVLLMPIVRDTRWSLAAVSAAMTIGFVAMAFGSMAWGALSDRRGPRTTAICGALIVPACLVLASRAHSLLAFQIFFGIGVGGGAAAIFAPMMACVTGWFDAHRALAVSLVSAGMGLAPMTMSPLAARLVTATHDWRQTLWLLGAVAVVLMVSVALVVRGPPDDAAPGAVPAASGSVAATAAAAGAAAAGAAGSGPDQALPGGLLRSPGFIVLLATNFFCCATHSGAIIHTVSYALTCGIPMTAAVSIYSVEGLAGMLGRIVFGILGDRLGAKRVLIGGLLAQAIGALGYLLAGGLIGFYAAATLFGFIYAGVMPLYAVLARENFPARMMGTIIGGTAMAGSLGMATGPVAGGLIYDALGTYRWLYLGSFLIGLGAFLIALLLPSQFKGSTRPGAKADGPDSPGQSRYRYS
ncbi:MAG TPA: MFS transporter [Steroidobacteraceae bacterium]|nr:MFS transporter [Steroidobacteraceae bacterium]